MLDPSGAALRGNAGLRRPRAMAYSLLLASTGAGCFFRQPALGLLRGGTPGIMVAAAPHPGLKSLPTPETGAVGQGYNHTVVEKNVL